MALHNQIKKFRLANNFTQSSLADKVGVSSSALAMYERGEREPGVDILLKLSSVFGVDMNVLFDKKQSPTKIPVLGYVAAGIPIETIEDILDYEDLSPDMLKDGSEYFGLKIKGDSMEPKISDGDVVIVRKQEDVDSGQIAIVGVNGEEATCKKVMKQEGGILLQPLNPSFAPVFYTVEQIAEIPITILGRVVELRAKF